MKRQIQILLVFFISLSLLFGCSANNNQNPKVKTTAAVKTENVQKNSDTPKLKTFTLSQLQDDFHQFQDTVEQDHPMLYTNKEELSQIFKSQYLLLKDNMDELEFYRVLAPIVLKLNCGHSNINHSMDFNASAAKYLPLTVRVVDNRAYVYQSLLSANIPVGAEILSINDKLVKEMLDIFYNNITADGSNITKKTYIINKWFSEQYFNYIGGPDNFSVTYKTASDDTVQTADFPSATKAAIEIAIQVLDPSSQNSEKYYQTFEKDYAVLTIKTFGFYDEGNRYMFKKYVDQFFKDVADKKIPNVILDLRDNWGGDPYCSAYVFSYLTKKAVPYFSSGCESYYYDLKHPVVPAKNNFKGKLYTLIDGASFSSTGHLCALLKYYKTGIFLGQESGGSFACTDSSRDYILAYSGLRFHGSRALFEVAVKGLTPGRGIIPEHIITPTIQNYINDKDVVKESAINLIIDNQL